MDTVDCLGNALVEDQGARPLETMGVEPHDLDGLDFVAAKDHWGSVGLVGLVRADHLDQSEIEQRVTTFDHLTRSLQQHAGVVRIYAPHGTASVRLGSFGVICFVFEDACPKDLSDVIRRQRRTARRSKQYTLPWSADVPTGRVRDHGLFPRGVFPSKRWMESAMGGCRSGRP